MLRLAKIIALSLLSLLCSYAQAAGALKTLHLEGVVNTAYSTIPFTFACGTKDAWIKTVDVTYVGVPTPAGAYGMIYAWDSVTNWTKFVAVNERGSGSGNVTVAFGADWMTVPPGRQWCLIWQFWNGNGYGLAYVDITYVCAP